MNCKQAEELLPLYAGRDLEEKRVTLVTEHLQTCAACTRVADEYHQFVQWTEQVASPVFSESVYAGIRQRVQREIQTEPIAPAWWQPIASLFPPKPSWAIAGVLLIALSLFAFYFIANRQNDGQQLADNPPAKVEPGTKAPSNSEPQSDTQAGLKPLVNTGGNKQQLAGASQLPGKRSRNATSMNTVAAKSRDARSTANNVSSQPRNLPEPMLAAPRDSAALVKTLRVEIQTKDPRIRIIWFVQQETKPVTPGSKGT